jgi:hypothetical protein
VDTPAAFEEVDADDEPVLEDALPDFDPLGVVPPLCPDALAAPLAVEDEGVDVGPARKRSVDWKVLQLEDAGTRG